MFFKRKKSLLITSNKINKHELKLRSRLKVHKKLYISRFFIKKKMSSFNVELLKDFENV